MDDVKEYEHKVEVIQTRPAFKIFKVVDQRDENGKGKHLPAVQAVFG